MVEIFVKQFPLNSCNSCNNGKTINLDQGIVTITFSNCDHLELVLCTKSAKMNISMV